MKISTKGRYGLRAMIDLAQHTGYKQIPIKNIAKRQDISESYLEQVFSILKKAGLVKSVQGSYGGYLLSESPSSITVGHILEVLEGNLLIVDETKNLDKASNIQIFLNQYLWRKVNQAVQTQLYETTLSDLIQLYGEKNKTCDMYYI